MTKTIEQARREAFEAWLTEQGFDFEWMEARNLYKDFACHMAWRAYNAALDSLCITLPEEKPMSHYHERESASLAFNDALECCREAIHAAGVRCK